MLSPWGVIPMLNSAHNGEIFRGMYYNVPMKTTPWEVNAKKLSDSYIAGFLDGDGSIMASVENRPERRRFPYRIRLRINFTQHERHRKLIEIIRNFLGNVGAVREVKSHKLVELVIQDRKEVEYILKRLLRFIILKERQAKCLLEIIEIYKKATVNTRSSLSEKEYMDILNLVQKVRSYNSSTGGRIQIKAFNPVTTQS
jgi:hypothetical protein